MSQRKIIFLIIPTVILISIFSPNLYFSRVSAIPQNDAGLGSDAPDSEVLANLLALNSSYTGTIGDTLTNIDNEADNHDYYKIDLPSSGNLSVGYVVNSKLNSSLSSVSILLNGRWVGHESFWEDDLLFNLVVPIQASSTFHIEINSYSDYVEYNFTIAFYSGDIPLQSDAGISGDASQNNPRQVNLDVDYDGTIGFGAIENDGTYDDRDRYTVTLPSQGYLDVDAVITTPDSYSDFDCYIRTPSGDTIISEYVGIFSSIISRSAPIAAAGTYVIDFDSYSWNASYSFILSFTPATLPEQHDTNANGDASAEFSNAPTVGVNTTISGTVGEELLEVSNNARDDDDLYKLGPVQYGILNLTLKFVESLDSFPTIYMKLYNGSDLFQFRLLSIYASSSTIIKKAEILLYPDSNYYLDLWTLDTNVTYEVEILFFNQPYTPPTTTTTSSQTTTTSSTTTTNTDISEGTTTSKSSNTETKPTTSSSSTEDQSDNLVLLFSPVSFLILLLIRRKVNGTNNF